MVTTHISLAEFVADPVAVAARAQAGEEISIEDGEKPTLVLKPVHPGSGASTKISEVLAGLEEDELIFGSPLVMDEDFAADMREIIANRKPRDTSAWD